MLGAGQSEAEVRDANRKLIVTSCLIGGLFGGVMAAISGVFPGLYNTTEDVRTLASRLILISAFMMPFNAYTNAAYFTLRSGGQTFATFLFDSFYVWTICSPVAYCLTAFTDLPIIPIFMCVQFMDLIKCGLGAWMLKKGAWIQTLVKQDS